MGTNIADLSGFQIGDKLCLAIGLPHKQTPVLAHPCDESKPLSR